MIETGSPSRHQNGSRFISFVSAAGEPRHITLGARS